MATRPVAAMPVDIHDLAPEQFLDEVRSFQFWFEAVGGYLSGSTYGHHAEMAEPPREERERERLITVLCNYCVGETAALEGASGLIAIAPDRRAKIFLATQVADEARHLEVLSHRLQDLGVRDAEAEIPRRAGASLLLFKRRLLDLVASRDWEAAIFAQNVILEALEFAVFHRHAQTADAITAEVLNGIIKDERRHIGFGENEIGRCLALAPHRRARLAQVRKELDQLVLDALEETVRNIGLARDEEARLGRSYRESVERLGF